MVKTELMSITPELASEWLTHNYTGQRKLSQNVVGSYAHDIKNGNWDMDCPDPIMFAEDGTLINGQHRLNAIIRAGVPCYMLVGRGYRKDTFAYLDNGFKRNVGDYLGNNGKLNAAITNVVFCLAEGEFPITTSLSGLAFRGQRHGVKPSRYDLVEYFRGNADSITRYAKMAHRMRQVLKVGSEKAFGAFLWMVSNLNTESGRVEEFVNAFCSTGESIVTEGLKTIILRTYASPTSTPTMDWLLGTLLQGFDAFCADKPVRSFNKSSAFIGIYDNKLTEWRKAHETGRYDS